MDENVETMVWSNMLSWILQAKSGVDGEVWEGFCKRFVAWNAKCGVERSR